MTLENDVVMDGVPMPKTVKMSLRCTCLITFLLSLTVMVSLSVMTIHPAVIKGAERFFVLAILLCVSSAIGILFTRPVSRRKP